MSGISISKLAVEKITKDPKFRQLRESKPEGGVPLLYYYRRCLSTLNDGTITEHGDGFSLSFVDPEELPKSRGIAYESVPIGDEGHVIVGGPVELISGGFKIDWSKNKFALEPVS